MKFLENIHDTYSENQIGTSKHYIWDEIEYAKLVINNGEPISNHIFKDVYLLAKYYRHVEKLEDESIKKKLENFVNLDDYSWDMREAFQTKIEGAIQGSKKQYMKVYKEIKITQNEIDIINNMSDNSTRKIAFTILCMWKANSNKPFRATIHQIANEIGLNANGKKLIGIYDSLLKDQFIYRYNRTAERRKRIIEKLVEVDSQYGQLFIPYDSFKYVEHVSSPTRKSNIALWIYMQYHDEYPELNFPSHYENMTVEEKEKYKQFRYEVLEEDFYGDDELDRFLSSVNLEYIKKNIEVISRCYHRDDFARIIGGDVFYTENGANDKVKVLFADDKCSDGILIDVNELSTEYEKIFGENKIVYGKCSECDCRIIKKSNRTKYCNDCKVKIRNAKVKKNMQNMRNKTSEG